MHNAKLKQLLYSDDIETVNQGISLLESLYSDVEEMFSFLGERVPISLSDWKERFTYSFEAPISQYLYLWLLGKCQRSE